MNKIESDVKIDIKLNSPDCMPVYMHDGDAAFDLKCDRILAPGENTGRSFYLLKPQERVMVMTGVRVSLPKGYELQIRPRSGLAIKHGITVLNSPGTIDSGYRGEIGVILYNSSSEPFEIKRGMRIAQAVLASTITAFFNEVEDLDITDRGEGGFGSTDNLQETVKEQLREELKLPPADSKVITTADKLAVKYYGDKYYENFSFIIKSFLKDGLSRLSVLKALTKIIADNFDDEELKEVKKLLEADLIEKDSKSDDETKEKKLPCITVHPKRFFRKKNGNEVYRLRVNSSKDYELVDNDGHIIKVSQLKLASEYETIDTERYFNPYNADEDMIAAFYAPKDMPDKILADIGMNDPDGLPLFGKAGIKYIVKIPDLMENYICLYEKSRLNYRPIYPEATEPVEVKKI